MKNHALTRHSIAVAVILFMFVAFGSPEVHAAKGDFRIDLNLASKHTNASQYTHNGKTEDYNERNFGLGLAYDIDGTFEVTGGFFRNSYDKHSNYLGIKAKHDFIFGYVTVTPGITAGFVTGYDDTEVDAPKYQPMAVPSISVEYNNFSTTVGYIPLRTVSDASTDVVTFQLGYKF